MATCNKTNLFNHEICASFQELNFDFVMIFLIHVLSFALQVGMYLKSVNDKNVLYWTHREVAQEMLRGQDVTNLVVIIHRRVAHQIFLLDRSRHHILYSEKFHAKQAPKLKEFSIKPVSYTQTLEVLPFIHFWDLCLEWNNNYYF